jgi:hypothetical protein
MPQPCSWHCITERPRSPPVLYGALFRLSPHRLFTLVLLVSFVERDRIMSSSRSAPGFRLPSGVKGRRMWLCGVLIAWCHLSAAAHARAETLNSHRHDADMLWLALTVFLLFTVWLLWMCTRPLETQKPPSSACRNALYLNAFRRFFVRHKPKSKKRNDHDAS